MCNSWKSCSAPVFRLVIGSRSLFFLQIPIKQKKRRIDVWRQKTHRGPGTVQRGINQTAACVMGRSMRYRVYDCLSSPPQLFFLCFIPFFFVFARLPLPTSPRPLHSLADSLCFMQKLSCPEGIDLPDRFDPDVMILSFSATSLLSAAVTPQDALN